ncbi:hypothetical protein ACP275_08G166200 [Erythranthe tilingii]
MMTADVSSMVRMMNGGDTNESATSGKSTAPITRDLLGGCCTLDSKELDLDVQVPSGWEKRLDLKSGKVYLQRCNSSNSSSTTSENNNKKFEEDLNLPPITNQKTTTTTTLNLFEDSSLELKLLMSSPSTSSNYQSSVCTLDKVRWALERAEKETARKRSLSIMSDKSSSSPPPRSTSSSSVKDSCRDRDGDEKSSTATVAAGCPRCLLYVLVSRGDPRCPRCNGDVPLPVGPAKKPRIDLNISI